MEDKGNGGEKMSIRGNKIKVIVISNEINWR